MGGECGECCSLRRKFLEVRGVGSFRVEDCPVVVSKGRLRGSPMALLDEEEGGIVKLFRGEFLDLG